MSSHEPDTCPADSIQAALTACLSLTAPSSARDTLWLRVQAAICTRTSAEITPFGSSAHVLVTRDHASDELITAMAWLYDHESQARALTAPELYGMLRCLATRSYDGSARSAQADRLHGVTGVPSGVGLRWLPLDATGQP